MALPGSRLRRRSSEDARGSYSKTGMDLANLIREDNNQKRLRQSHINMMNQSIRQKAWQAKNMSRDMSHNFTRDAIGYSESSDYSDEDPRKYYGTHQNEEDDSEYRRNDSQPVSNSAEGMREGLELRAKQQRKMSEPMQKKGRK